MRWLTVFLLLLLIGLQFRLWVGEGSIGYIVQLKREIALQKQENATLNMRNQKLYAEVKELKSGLDGIEERARLEQGLIKEGETFYLVIEEKPSMKDAVDTPNDAEIIDTEASDE